MTDPDEKGMRRVFFQLNGFPRALEVFDEGAKNSSVSREKADPLSSKHVAAPMPGKVLEVRIQVGASIKKGDTLLVTEAMKMEYAVTAKSDGEIVRILVNKEDFIEEGDLLVELE
jgi:pyruvate carboxylase